MPSSIGERSRRKSKSRRLDAKENGSSRSEITESASTSNMRKLSLGCLNAWRAVSMPAPELDWLFVSGLSSASEGVFGPSPPEASAQPFTSLFRCEDFYSLQAMPVYKGIGCGDSELSCKRPSSSDSRFHDSHMPVRI